MARTRNTTIGPASPVAVPDELTWQPTAAGHVVLPITIEWSGERSPAYDLTNRQHRLRVYRLVLSHGTEADVRRYVDPDQLVALWDDLLLPRHVEAAWAGWVARHRSGT